MKSIKFNYLYRDGSNYKSLEEVVFSNSENLTVNEITARLLDAFLPDKQFIADQVSIPEKFLFTHEKFTRDDHCYHEFDCVEACEEESTDALGRSVSDFLWDVEVASKQGWKAFDILDRAY
jgi:alpha-D-ribose 1-methylphosphonate 5-phosphate C-P lyase